MPNASSFNRLSLERMQAELQVFLNEGVPPTSLILQNWGTSNVQLLVPAITQKGNVYTLHFYLNGYPHTMPRISVGQMLRDREGNLLNTPSGAMHCLSPSPEGYTTICHMGASNWSPNQSLFKCYVRACIWLNMYELHLEKGYSIDHWLKHAH